MFYKRFIEKKLPQEEIIQMIKKEGFNPLLISDSPGYVYPKHKHPETKLLVCINGSMKIVVDNEIFNFEPGDKLIIPGNTYHSAKVGENGCDFFWSEKLM